MNDATIITLTILGILTLAILVTAGLVLSAHSFTQLVELTRLVGSWVEQQTQGNPPAQTTSSVETEVSTPSVPPEDTRTMPEKGD